MKESWEISEVLVPGAVNVTDDEEEVGDVSSEHENVSPHEA